jgi:hypothetical protein
MTSETSPHTATGKRSDEKLDADGTGGSMKNAVLALWQFQNSIEIGDIVYAKWADVRSSGGARSFRNLDTNDRKSRTSGMSVQWWTTSVPGRIRASTCL